MSRVLPERKAAKLARSRGVRLLPWALASLCACDATLEPQAGDSSPYEDDLGTTGVADPPEAFGLRQLSFRLDWNLESVTILDEGGFRLHTNLNYEVEVHHGYLVNYSLSLIPCADTATLGMGTELNKTTEAFRGDELEVDPSTIEAPLVESLSTLEPVRSPTVTITPHIYCGLHYLLARGDEDTPNMPTDVDLMRKSLYLAGSYRTQGESQWTAFETKIDIASADIFVIGPTLGRADLTRATIVLTRRLAGLLDNLDFKTSDAKGIGRQALENLVAPAQLSVAIEANDV